MSEAARKKKLVVPHLSLAKPPPPLCATPKAYPLPIARSRAGSGFSSVEDPNGDVRDLYGHIVPDHLHQEYIDWRRDSSQKNAARSREFASILSSTSEPYLDFDLSRLFRMGIPPHMRRLMWLQITGVGNKIARNQGYYESLKQAREGTESDSARDQIGRDLQRTFGSNTSMQTEQSREKLGVVLRCYARHDRSIGYCQSMNFLVSALLLLDFSEEEAFWMLDHIVSLMPDCYSRDLLGMRADMEALTYYMRSKVPNVHNFFLRHGDISADLYAMPMIMCWYVGYVPYETMFRIWDRIMYGGVLELFRSALKLFSFLESHILAAEGCDMTDIMNTVAEGHLSLIDPDAALAKMPGVQRMEPGELSMRRMRIRERMYATREKTRSPIATQSGSPVSSRNPGNASGSLRRTASFKNASASAHITSLSASAAAATTIQEATNSERSAAQNARPSEPSTATAQRLPKAVSTPSTTSQPLTGNATLRFAQDMVIGDDSSD